MKEIDLKRAIEASIKLFQPDYYNLDFNSYCSSYFFTNEEISNYIKFVPESAINAFTVLSSGDHLFNLALHGIKNIDAFDINYLQYFTFWLKYAMISKLSYQEFLILNKERFYLDKNQLNHFNDLILRLKPYMPKEVYNYYEALINYQKKHLDSYSLSFLYRGYRIYDFVKNNYASSESYYNTLKANLSKVNINFYFGDIIKLSENLSFKYDVIFLSNVLEYIANEKNLTNDFNRIISLFSKYLNLNGVMINYFCFSDFFNINWNKVLVDYHYEKKLCFTNHGEGYHLVRKKM